MSRAAIVDEAWKVVADSQPTSTPCPMVFRPSRDETRAALTLLGLAGEHVPSLV